MVGASEQLKIKERYNITNQKGESIVIDPDEVIEKAAIYLKKANFVLSGNEGMNQHGAKQAIRRTLELEEYNPLIKFDDDRLEQQIGIDASRVLELFKEEEEEKNQN